MTTNAVNLALLVIGLSLFNASQVQAQDIPTRTIDGMGASIDSGGSLTEDGIFYQSLLCRGGKKVTLVGGALQFEVESYTGGTVTCNNGFTPGGANAQDKTELYFFKNVDFKKRGRSRFKLWVPDTFAPDGWFIFFQLWQAGGGHPVVHLAFDDSGNKFNLTGRTGGETSETTVVNQSWDLPKNQWVHFELDWEFDTATSGNTGYLKLKVNGVEKKTYYGKLGYERANQKRIECRFGIYRSGFSSKSHRIKFDDISVQPISR